MFMKSICVEKEKKKRKREKKIDNKLQIGQLFYLFLEKEEKKLDQVNNIKFGLQLGIVILWLRE